MRNNIAKLLLEYGSDDRLDDTRRLYIILRVSFSSMKMIGKYDN